MGRDGSDGLRLRCFEVGISVGMHDFGCGFDYVQ